MHVQSFHHPFIVITEAKILDDAEACYTPPIAEQMNRVKSDFLRSL